MRFSVLFLQIKLPTTTSKILTSVNETSQQKANFRKETVIFLKTMVAKLEEKSPLKKMSMRSY